MGLAEEGVLPVMAAIAAAAVHRNRNRRSHRHRRRGSWSLLLLLLRYSRPSPRAVRVAGSTTWICSPCML